MLSTGEVLQDDKVRGKNVFGERGGVETGTVRHAPDIPNLYYYLSS
jgi:hypothetical protein